MNVVHVYLQNAVLSQNMGYREHFSAYVTLYLERPPTFHLSAHGGRIMQKQMLFDGCTIRD